MFYHVITSNGQHHAIEASSASEAIGKALNENRGLTVQRCYIGQDNGGKIEFEVPAHLPISARQESAKGPETGNLFDESI